MLPAPTVETGGEIGSDHRMEGGDIYMANEEQKTAILNPEAKKRRAEELLDDITNTLRSIRTKLGIVLSDQKDVAPLPNEICELNTKLANHWQDLEILNDSIEL